MLALTYASTANTEFDEDALEALAEQAGGRNTNLMVTGYLFHIDGRFFQYLEGSEAAVSKLFSRIAADPRHTVARIVELGNIEERRFGDWSMRYVTRSEIASFDMEQVAEDVLASMTDEVFVNDELREQVLAMVRQLAEAARQGEATGMHGEYGDAWRSEAAEA